jgi:hypothetical protein
MMLMMSREGIRIRQGVVEQTLKRMEWMDRG